jgi:flotillin
MMEEMCIGATRRLVANLTIEECLTAAKTRSRRSWCERWLRSSRATAAWRTRLSSGWGLLVDTIEIQDVRVTSAQVFANMQARFRQEQERFAREAELVTEQDVELARVSAQTEVRRKKQLAEENAKLEKIAGDAKVDEQRVAQERAHARQSGRGRARVPAREDSGRAGGAAAQTARR